MPFPSAAPLILAGALPDSTWLSLSLRQQAAHHPGWHSFAARARLMEASIAPAGTVPEPGHLRYLAQCFQLERAAVWPAFELLNTLLKDRPPNQPRPAGASSILGPALNDPGLHVVAQPESIGFWRLQPVHFLLGRDHIRLMDPGSLNLEEDEASALWQAVQPLFSAEGLTLGMHAPGIWWLTAQSGAAALALQTFSLSGAIGRSIEARLPQGEHRRRWQRLLNECQMVWHTHPVNAQRESRGQWPINGLWIEGPARSIGARDLETREPSTLQPTAAVNTPPLEHRIDHRLLDAQHAGDPSGWLEAWQQVCRDHFQEGRMPQVAVLTGDGGWRVLSLSAKGQTWAEGLKRLLRQDSSSALDWLMP